MSRIVASEYVHLEELADKIRHEINSIGYVIVQHLYKDKVNIDELKTALLNLCGAVGTVTSHNSHNTPIWDIKSRQSESVVNTFSEHADEAELHTDSQYSERPEDHFALYCVEKALCKGGESFFLKVEDIVNDLNESVEGREVISFLKDSKYPYIVPDVFKRNLQGPPEFTFGYILKDGEMRFRLDAIERALAIDPTLCTKKQVDIFKFLKDTIFDSKKVIYTYLENNECLFINNKTMLHGRTKFVDPNRHLLRIRFNNK
jgi:alpha-ketoglutarate-dependent taurine dioxygenase